MGNTIEKLIERNLSLIDELHKSLLDGGVQISKEMQSDIDELKRAANNPPNN